MSIGCSDMGGGLSGGFGGSGSFGGAGFGGAGVSFGGALRQSGAGCATAEVANATLATTAAIIDGARRRDRGLGGTVRMTQSQPQLGGELPVGGRAALGSVTVWVVSWSGFTWMSSGWNPGFFSVSVTSSVS